MSNQGEPVGIFWSWWSHVSSVNAEHTHVSAWAEWHPPISQILPEGKVNILKKKYFSRMTLKGKKKRSKSKDSAKHENVASRRNWTLYKCSLQIRLPHTAHGSLSQNDINLRTEWVITVRHTDFWIISMKWVVKRRIDWTMTMWRAISRKTISHRFHRREEGSSYRSTWRRESGQ